MIDAVRAASDLLTTEAMYLDERRWDDWLNLLDDGIEFWVPAWTSTGTPTNDPEAEVSLIYVSSKRQLQERVARLRSGRSAALSLLPRTSHMITNLQVHSDKHAARIFVKCAVAVYSFDPKRRESTVMFGRYEHELAFTADSLRIRRKKVLVLNDHFSSFVDFFTV